MQYWYTYQSFAFCDENDTDPGSTPVEAAHGEALELLRDLKKHGWEEDQTSVKVPGWLYVRRKVDTSHPDILSGFASLAHIAETVKSQADTLAQLKRVCATQQKTIEELETRAQHQADTLGTVLGRLNAPAEPAHPQGVDKTEPLADIVDYEAAGAPWTLTIEGGKRR